jgi:hypothetical protein
MSEYQTRLESLKALIAQTESHISSYGSLTPVEFKGVAPDAYTAFITALGWGDIFDGGYAVYKTPIPLSEIVGESDEVEGYLAMGDNFSGDLLVFNTSHSEVIYEYWHDDYSFQKIEGDFIDFIEEMLQNNLRD